MLPDLFITLCSMYCQKLMQKITPIQFLLICVLVGVSIIAFAQSSTRRVHWVGKEQNPAYFEKNTSLPALLLSAVKAKKTSSLPTPTSKPTFANT